jgi:hypothetical protein
MASAWEIFDRIDVFPAAHGICVFKREQEVRFSALVATHKGGQLSGGNFTAIDYRSEIFYGKIGEFQCFPLR